MIYRNQDCFPKYVGIFAWDKSPAVAALASIALTPTLAGDVLPLSIEYACEKYLNHHTSGLHKALWLNVSRRNATIDSLFCALTRCQLVRRHS